MTSRAPLTRGPLPARVYWRRRILVLGSAALLVFAIGRVLVGGSDASSSDGAVTPAAGSPTGVPTVTVTDRARRQASQREARRDREREPVLAEPTGECAAEDIAVTPTVDDAVAGGDVRLGLELRTVESEACTWTVSPETLTLKITSGNDDIWASSECPRTVPTRDLIVRRDVTTEIGVVWSGKRSDDDACERGTEWARQGWYHLEAAALAGEPSDVQFELALPTGEHITETVQPEPEQEKKKDEPKRR